jgi:hypothetical protein
MGIRGQEEVNFGAGHFVGPLYDDPTFRLNVEGFTDSEARFVGWTNGCPVVEELIDPETGRGPEAMLHRYGEVNYWFVHIADAAKEANQDLYRQLITPVPRLADEPVRKYEPVSVPEIHVSEMAPMGTLPGWALPRLFIQQLGDSKKESAEEAHEEVQGRLMRGLDVLDHALQEATTPAELLALVAEGVSQADLARQEVLKTVLSRGWLEEHNATSMMSTVKAALEDKAPEVWDAYSQLTTDEKISLGIV